MDDLKKTANRPGIGAPQSMWRYADVLPKVDPITLGEGWTPILQSRRYPVFIKEEATNPTGSFKARGMSMAVSMAQFYGIKKLTAPSVCLINSPKLMNSLNFIYLIDRLVTLQEH